MKDIYIAEPTILIKGDNKGEELMILPERVLYIRAADNYVRIYFINEEKIQFVLFRSTMKKQTELFSRYSFFYRCHKKYLVNFIHVHRATGKLVDLRLYIQGIRKGIPVSRSQHQQTIALFERMRLQST